MDGSRVWVKRLGRWRVEGGKVWVKRLGRWREVRCGSNT